MPGRPSGKSADGRARLLDACWALLLENEPGERLTITAVCEQAGVTPPTLYHHFGDLGSLEAAASQRAFTQWQEKITEEASSAGTPEERLKRFTDAYLAWAMTHPDAYIILFSRPGQLGSDGKGPRFQSMMTSLSEIHGLPVDDPSLMAISFSLWAGLHGAAMLLVVAPLLPLGAIQTTMDHLTDAINSYGPPPESPWFPGLLQAHDPGLAPGRGTRRFRY